jgi:hypothetical protein
MPQLVHAWLQQVDGRQQLEMRSAGTGLAGTHAGRAQRRVVAPVTGIGLLGVAVLLRWFDMAAPYWGPMPVSTWVAGGFGVLALVLAWRR